MATGDTVLGFDASVLGWTELNALIDRVVKKASEPFDRETAHQVRDAYIARVENAFRTRGASVGGWRPLSPEYAGWKRNRYPGRPLLIASGEMQQAVTRTNNSQFVFDRKPSRVTLGSNSPLAGYHQAGTDRMPSRPLFVNDRSWGKEVGEIVRDYLFASEIETVLSAIGA